VAAANPRGLPVVAMSREDCRDHAKHPGCDDVLPKPFLLEELVNVLKRWLPARR
jgi:CheY-like chemotaxis protein